MRKQQLKKYSSKTLKALILSLTAAGFITSCAPKTTTDAGSKTLRSEKLAQGKTIFENSCNRCHDLPDPKSHSAQNWMAIMNSMAPKAKLNAEQHVLVYDYIVSVK